MTDHITEPITCMECHGTGDHSEHPWRPCPFCYGNGVRYVTKVSAPGLYVDRDEPPGHDLPEVERGGAT